MSAWLQDLSELATVKQVVADAKKVVNYFATHTISAQILNRYCHISLNSVCNTCQALLFCRASNGAKKLEQESNTRFATVVRVLGSLMALHKPIQAAVNDAEFPTTSAAQEILRLTTDSSLSFGATSSTCMTCSSLLLTNCTSWRGTTSRWETLTGCFSGLTRCKVFVQCSTAAHQSAASIFSACTGSRKCDEKHNGADAWNG
jgi:hypothetical protein